MPAFKLTPAQRDIIRAKKSAKFFVHGIAGTGKSTVGVERLKHLLKAKTPATQITVLLPQQTVAVPYHDALNSDDNPAGAQVSVTTLGSIARRAVDLFWPLLPQSFGFAHPERRPVFLTLETAQYFMARVAGPQIDLNGYFDSVKIDRNRLYSQVIDNLNKAAVIDDFEYTEIAERLKSAWTGDHDQTRMYDDVQTCAHLFRAYCLDYNLLDFSLQIEAFKALWQLEPVKSWLFTSARQVIADNVEEDTPFAHTILQEVIQQAQGALILYDEDAGYRQFLGADDDNAAAILPPTCEQQIRLTDSFVMGAEVQAFSAALAHSLTAVTVPTDGGDKVRAAFAHESFRYHPQMVGGVATEVIRLVEQDGIAPGEIVVIAPYVSDALRFSLMNHLESAGVPVRSHRPSRSLRQEPAAQALLILAQVAHPAWGIPPTMFDIAYTLMQSIAGIDLVRAQLLARYAYKIEDNRPTFLPFEALAPNLQERVTFFIGERYERLRQWLTAYHTDALPDLDHFFSRLFGEVLSQAGFGFHDTSEIPNKDAATVAANLINSAQKFRQMMTQSGAEPTGKSAAQEYIEMVNAGIIADQYLAGWQETHHRDAVLIAPAYTYLLSNRPVDFQFWLNVSGSGWSERVFQPLTNPHVLALNWQVGEKWTEENEIVVAQAALYRLMMGLLRRCRRGVYVTFSELSESGYEQRGDLLAAFQRVLRADQA